MAKLALELGDVFQAHPHGLLWNVQLASELAEKVLQVHGLLGRYLCLCIRYCFLFLETLDASGEALQLVADCVHGLEEERGVHFLDLS